jgi:hypothetical protein
LFIGRNTRALANNQTNQIVIGDSAIGLGSNTVVVGNDSIVTTALKGNVGIGTTNPTSASLTVNGNIWATSLTGSLFGTASFVTSASYASNATYATFINGYDITNFILTGGNQSKTGSLDITGSLSIDGVLSMSLDTGTPSNTTTPDGYYKATLNGILVYIPYYI